MTPYVILSSIVTLATIGTYNAQIKRFWGEIGPQWREHERALSDDTRNDMTD